MNLYLISQDDNTGYDTFDSAVVIAENEEAARQIHPRGAGPNEWTEPYNDVWAKKPANVKVVLLGTWKGGPFSNPVVCSSFNAG